MRVNLHTHSMASDGRLTPTQLVERLHTSHVQVMALTDHDTVNGIEEARHEANKRGIQFINGIEISTKIQGLELDFLDVERHTIHMLGLNYNYEILSKLFKENEKLKEARIKNLVEKLVLAGYLIKQQGYGNKKTGVAQELVRCGYAENTQDAFNHIINKYYPRQWDLVTVREVVDMIHTAKGVVIWAHPYEILYDYTKFRIDEAQVEEICEKLKHHQVDGIEVYYSKYNEEQVRFLKALQDRFGFLASAGTDFHAKDVEEETYIEIETGCLNGVLK